MVFIRTSNAKRVYLTFYLNEVILRQKVLNINMCSLHVLVVLLFSSTGAAEKPYTVEEAVSYNELDYLSVSVLHNRTCPWLGLLLFYTRMLPQTLSCCLLTV